MYRVLVNIDDKKSNRIVVDTAKDITVITEAFFKIATGKDYELSDDYKDEDIKDEWENHFHYTLEDPSIWLRVKRLNG